MGSRERTAHRRGSRPGRGVYTVFDGKGRTVARRWPAQRTGIRFDVRGRRSRLVGHTDMAGITSGDTDRGTFVMDQFRVTEPGRLEVSGRWEGVRGANLQDCTLRLRVD